MPWRNNRLTVIVIPQTGKRSLSFQMATIWAILGGTLVAALLAIVAILVHNNRMLKADIAALQAVKQVNRLQQVEIDTMAQKAEETQQKMDALQRLEQQIRELTGQDAAPKTSRGDAGVGAAVSSRGRGGPGGRAQSTESLPTLSGLLPPDVSAFLFTPRTISGGDPQNLSTQVQVANAATEQATATRTLMEAQLAEMDRLEASLSEGKETIADRLDYLAHRPSGLPVDNPEFTDRFGWRWSPFGLGRQFHAGLDMAQQRGTPIYATAAGVVTLAGWKDGGYGNAVVIDHGYGFETLYAHMSDWNVKVGQEVSRGTLIGWVGSTGDSTGPHVHYEVHVDGTPVDPTKYLD